MKKYITIAALLAAGSACANAADLTLADAVAHSSTDITNISNVSGSFSYTLVFDTDAMIAILGNNGSNSVRPMLALANNNYNMGLATALNNTGFVGTAGVSSMGNLTMGGVGTESRQPMTESGSTLKTNNFADGSSDGKGGLTVPQNLTSQLSNLSGLAVTFSHTDKTSSSLFVTLQFTDSNKQTTTTKLYGTSTGFKWSTGDGVGSLKNLYINETYVSDVYLFNSDVSQTKAFELNAAAIPEPSAFGLLAGIGALALVASRRRRK